jgi:hypothetical protein
MYIARLLLGLQPIRSLPAGCRLLSTTTSLGRPTASTPDPIKISLFGDALLDTPQYK